jgi:membrane protease YdiL (CAAX protease family)
MSNAGTAAKPLTGADWAVVVVALILPTAITWFYFIALAKAPAAVQQTAYAAVKSVQFALPAVWVWLVQRERLTIPRPRFNGLLLGAVFGLAVAAAMAALYFAVLKPRGLFAAPAGEVRAKIAGFGINTLAGYLLFALFCSAMHSLAEEYYWRWFVFRQLSRGSWLAVAIAVSSLAFAAHHVLVLAVYFGWTSPLTWLFSAGVAIGGVVWSWLYHKSGSIYAPWLSHALVDAAIFIVGYDLIAVA